MQFSVGDKVVHPHHGPGRIVCLERRELLDGVKRYYEIEIPGQRLTIHLPVSRANEVGVRPAMSESGIPRVLGILRSEPQRLPEDYKERQEQMVTRLATGRAEQLVSVVRDLTWHRERAHLTRIDLEHLRQGRDLLAAEMALVTGEAVSDANKLIGATMAAALASTL